MDSLIYVKETPWGKLGTTIDKKPETSQELVESCGLDWEVASTPMKTDIHGVVPGWHAIYRPKTKDNDDSLMGVVHAANPHIIQNKDMFEALEPLMNSEFDFDCAGAYKNGKSVFGVFKIREDKPTKVLDDEVDNYILCVNDHLKPDGKVSIIHTPMRIICTNMLTGIINSSSTYYRIPITGDININRDLAESVFNNCQDAIVRTDKEANKLYNIKITRDNIEEILDNLFPYQMTNTGDLIDSKANENISIMRDTFVDDCMQADNLNNYRGTAYQVYNALLDYQQHYYTKADYTYDLDKRMARIPKFAETTEEDRVKKFMKMLPKFAAAA